jgi:hypothetical protein|tara:strand:- start:3616 stop:3774 length:159 start_codon:yes stop_codon:yes gene_type:complete
MRCYICNNILLDREIHINEDGKSEPCFNCLEKVYVDGYPFNINVPEIEEGEE